MMEGILVSIKVRDVHTLLAEEAFTIGPDCSVDELLERLVENPRTRHAYVVDGSGRLIGSVRPAAFLRCLFPIATLDRVGRKGLVEAALATETVRVRDIMSKDPSSLYEHSTLAEMVELMIREDVSELPVLDDQRRVVGEVSLPEVAAAYFKLKRDG